MLVLDSSAFVALELERATPEVVAALARSGHWVVPEHFRVEAFNALRGLWFGRKLDDARFERSTRRLQVLDLDVWPTAPLLPRIRELATNATAYDAAYLALAEELSCPLVTADEKFARVPGIRCSVLGGRAT
ncbi:MAG TPA: type II toxin-antitoxin system VapC family toxin [Pseudolysinimonas sp.]|nr:type II toxin-antitoxin system VapC family toxin [Pseudolysinimonas sp.]